MIENHPNSTIAFFSLNTFYIVRSLLRTSVTSMSLLRSSSVNFVLNVDHSLVFLFLQREKMLLSRTVKEIREFSLLTKKCIPPHFSDVISVVLSCSTEPMNVFMYVALSVIVL